MARLAENPGRYGDAEDAANPSHRRVYSPPQKEARPSYYQDSDLPTASRFWIPGKSAAYRQRGDRDASRPSRYEL